MFLSRNGSTEFQVIGTLKDWNIIEELHKISVPTLVTNGRYDEATDTVVYPFFKNIPRVKWVQFSVSFFQFANSPVLHLNSRPWTGI